MMTVHYRRGLHVPAIDLWLDPSDRKEIAFVSHAHSDHTGAHGHVLCTSATAALMRCRVRGRSQYRALEYGRGYDFPDFRLTLYPAGHVLGSAQALVETDAGRLLYSGDFKLRPGRAAEAIEVPQADVVVMETTFGRPRYQFPPTEEVVRDIHAFCEQTVAAGAVPILFGYALGKSQELLAQLADCTLPLVMHPSLREMVAIYEAFGVRFPAYQLWEPGLDVAGHVVLCSTGARRSLLIHELPRKRTAHVSGWALDRRAAWRFGADACFPLSDHADYDELLEYVRLTGARQILTVHGFAAEFAQDLRLRGFNASAVEEPAQLSLF
jgi:Cft2 family RNA processing exonuclease